MRRRRLTAGLAGLGVVTATAVTAAALTVGAPTVSPTTEASARADELQRFGSCRQLRLWYTEAALDRVTPWGLEGPPYVAVPDFSVDGVARRAVAGTELAPVANGATGTNLQEAGVDEPDLAKTDGERVVLIDGSDLVVVDVTGTQPAQVGRLALPDGRRPDELLLVGDRAVLLGATGERYPAYDSRASDALIRPHPWVGRATVTTVDISDPAAPTIVADEDIDGTVVSAREHDGTVRIVVSSRPRLDFKHPGGGTSREQALQANRQLIRGASAADWLPTRTTAGGDLSERLAGGPTTRLVRCGDVRHPAEDSGLGLISVLTLDPAESTRAASTAVTADGSMVYASPDRLYVATTAGGWIDTWRGGPADSVARSTGDTVTAVHAFATEGDGTAYAASGEVTGSAPDRWAFSEHQGRLRVATMLGHRWAPRESIVTVLEESAGELVEVGKVGGLGRPRETIRAVRWFDETAVVVTFRQTDPLYTLDLSDPTAPRVVGELKIAGFSAYLHPVGGDLLLGVGQDADSRGRTRGSQLSTFDLADLADPRRLDTADLGRGRSPVEDDARAFTYLPDRRLALVPTGHRRGEERVAAVRVATDGSLTRTASLHLSGRLDSVRTLPLDDGRVAMVGGGRVQRLLATEGLAQ